MNQIIFYYDEKEVNLDLVVQCYEVLLEGMTNYTIKLLPIEAKYHEIQQEK